MGINKIEYIIDLISKMRSQSFVFFDKYIKEKKKIKQCERRKNTATDMECEEILTECYE